MRKHIFGLLAILLATEQVLAAKPAVRVEGVEFQRQLVVNDQALEIRGYGLLRYLTFIKAYAGALYLPPSVLPAEALAPVARRLELAYFRSIRKEDFAKATRKKMADNVTPQELHALGERLDQLCRLYRDVRPGDRYALTYTPGQGTALTLNGTLLGVIQGSDFARAVFAIWLGADPIDASFRDRLLGDG